jgi:hypothetical protein
MKDKGAVVAEGAAEITAAKKYGGGNFSRIIQKRCFVETAYLHTKIPHVFYII